MKKVISLIVAVVLVLSLVPVASAKTIDGANYGNWGTYKFTILDQDTSILAPGITQDIVYAKMHRTGNQTVYYMAKANPQDEYVEVHANYKDNQCEEWGMQLVTDQMKAAEAKHQVTNSNYKVVAGINADFYEMSTGEPNGGFAMEGVIKKAPTATGTFFAVLQNGKAVIGYGLSDWNTFNAESPIQEAVGGGSILIQNGVIKNTNWGNENARTAIGVTENNEVVFLMVDGKQLPFSGGADMVDMAVILREAGCVDAINLDGGGSSTYAAREVGSDEIEVVNRPCDGYERIVSSSLMFVSTAPDSNEFSRAKLDPEFNDITPSTSVNIKAIGTTFGGTPIDIPEDAVWEVEPSNLGTVTKTADGAVFKAGEQEGLATINLKYKDTAAGTVTVNVVKPDKFEFALPSFGIPYNKTIEISAKATYEERTVGLNPNDVTMELTNPAQGTLTRKEDSTDTYVLESCDNPGEGVEAPTGKIKATLACTSTTIEADIILGKESVVLYDFEDETQINDFGTRIKGNDPVHYGNVTSEIEWVDAAHGKVHGDSDDGHAIKWTVDFSQMFSDSYGGSSPQGFITYVGEQKTLEGALGFGAWVWVPDEYAKSTFFIQGYNGVNNGDRVMELCHDKVGDLYDEGHWYYMYKDLTYIATTSFKTGGDILCYILWQQSEDELYKSQNNRVVMYVDDITIDYSLVTSDRDMPEMRTVRTSTNQLLERKTVFNMGAAETVSFQAPVSDPVNYNTTGIDPSSAKAFIDGIDIGARYENGSVITNAVSLPAGVHTLKLYISDMAGNTTNATRQFETEANPDVATIVVEPHDKEKDKILIGSVYYFDVRATDVSKIQSVTMDLDLNNISVWELEHSEVNPKFKLTTDYHTGMYEEGENIATVTITRTGEYEEGDSNILASLPVRTWGNDISWTYKDDVDQQQKTFSAVEAWNNRMFYPEDITVDIDRGSITYVEDYEPDVTPAFGGERLQVDTELYDHPDNLHKVLGTDKGWHVHDTELKTISKEATCYENGYTNRKICATCGSVVDADGWGTVVPALKHEYVKGEDGILKCEHCEKTFTGVFTDGKTYTNGVMQKDGWTEDDRYFRDGEPLNGVQIVEEKYYDFGTDGVCKDREVYTGFFEHGGKRYYALDGVLQTGWFIVQETMYHTLEDGALHTTEMEDTRGCTTNGYKIYTCTVCPEDPETGLRPQFKSEALWWEGHTWDNNYHCTVCGADGRNIADCDLQIQGKYFDYRGPGVNVEASHRVIDEAAGGRWLYLNSDRRGVDGYSEFFNCADIGHAKVIVHGRGEYYGDIEGTYDIVPQSVKSVTATEVGQDGEHTSVKLTWEAPLGAEYYGVYKFDTAKNDWVKLGETEQTTYTIDGLTIGESYRFRVASRAVRNNEVFACTTWAYAEGTVEHHWVEDTEKSVKAECEKAGLTVRDCSVCQKHEEIELPATGHTVPDDAWEIVEEATTSAPGERKGICDVCGQEVTEEIPQLPPVFTGTGSSTAPGNQQETVENEDGSTTTTTTKPDGSTTETTKQTDGTVTEKNTDKSGVVTETTTKPDNTVTEKVTQTDGSATERTTTPDGVVGQKSTDAEGKVTSAEVVIPKEAEKQDVVTAPVEVPAAKTAEEAPEISVRTESTESKKVEIPVTEFGPGTVAIIVHEDGTEEVVRDCTIGENGVVLNVEGDVTLKIVDKAETFEDVEDANHWASNAVEFVAARELFNGTGENKFTPNGSMTRGMMVTVLYRLAYEPDAVEEGFADVKSDAYYSDAVAWAAENGVVNGYADNTFAPDDNVSREQLVTILHRYAQKKGYATKASGTLSGFADAQSVSSWASDAMSWAVELGLVNGTDASHISPAKSATRAEVATILMRFCEKVVK